MNLYGPILHLHTAKVLAHQIVFFNDIEGPMSMEKKQLRL